MNFAIPQLFTPPSARITPPNDMRPVPSERKFGLQQLLVPDVTYEDDGCSWSIDYGIYFPVVGERSSRLQIWGRRPFCTPSNFTPPPLPAPPTDLSNDRQADLGDGDTTIFCILYSSQERFIPNYTRNDNGFDRNFSEYRTKTEITITDAKYPLDFGNGIIGSKISATIKGITTKKYSNDPINGNLAGTTDIQTRTFYYSWDCHINSPSTGVEWLKYVNGSDRFFIRQGDINLYVCQGSPGFISNNLLNKQTNYNQNTFGFQPVYEQITNTDTTNIQGSYDRRWERLYRIENTKPFIPPPPPHRKEPDMTCCPEHDQLLKLILKRLGTLPANVPQDLTIKDAPILKINSLAEYVSYSVKQLDSLIGQFPLEIEIEDADLTEEGNQKEKMTIPNLSEAVGEILTLLLLLRSESDANLNASIRSLLETGQTKQIAQITHDYAEATATYLGYKGKLVEKPYPMMFTPGEEQLDKILKETQISLKTWEYEDRADLNDILAPILELAAMWKAQNFRNLGASSPTNRLMEILNTGLGLSRQLSNLNLDESDFDDFSRQVENGFINQPGVSDTTNPYGRDASRKPRVREVGTDTSD